jgi:zinc protease
MENVRPEDLEAALLGEVEILRNEPVGKAELDRAKNQLLARFIYDSDSVTEQGHQLGFFSVVHEFEYAVDFPNRIEEVRAEDVLEVARKYLSPDNRTVGWFLPTGEGTAPSDHTRRSGEVPHRRIATFRDAGFRPTRTPDITAYEPPDFSRIDPSRTVLDNGLTVLALRNPIGPSAHVRVTVRGGSAAEPTGKSGLATLTARYLLEGAGKHSGEELARTLDSKGSEIETNMERDFAAIELDVLTKEFEGSLELLGDIIREPRFPQSSLDRMKKEIMTEIREAEEDENAVSYQTLMEQIYPPGHPYGRRVLGWKEEVPGLRIDDVHTFYRNHYFPANVSIVVVGDLDPDDVVEKVKDVFEDWEGPSNPVRFDLPPVARQVEARKEVVTMDEKTQVSVAMGHLGVRRDDPDYAILQVMNNVLGQFGLGGRLGETIREDKGFAYFIFSVYSGAMGQSPFFIMASVAPEVVRETVETIEDELRQIVETGPSVEELNRSKRNVLGSLALSLEENEGIADRLADMELYGFGPAYLQEYVRNVMDVDLDQVRQAARDHIDPENISLAVVGPIDAEMNRLKVDDR